MQLNLKDVKLKVDKESIQRKKISDEEYFSAEYSDYISNSRLKLLDPSKGGSIEKYLAGFPDKKSHSFVVGDTIHKLMLQPESYELAPDLGLPTAKLGETTDRACEMRMNGYKIYDAIQLASHYADYFKDRLPFTKLQYILKLGTPFYYKQKEYDRKKYIFLSANDLEICNECVQHLKANTWVTKTLHPKDMFGDYLPTYNEEAFFVDIIAKYKDKETLLKLKMKVDNWSVDVENKKVILSDLKTSSHNINGFMDYWFGEYSYGRQFAIYRWLLQEYCKKEFKYDDEWTTRCVVIVCNTIMDRACKVFNIQQPILDAGMSDALILLKMLALYQMHDYSGDLEFV